MHSWNDAAHSPHRYSSRHGLPETIIIRQPLLVAACLLLGGCGGSKVDTVPVSGVVTMDGEPVADILVNFQPTRDTTADASQSPSSYGITDEKGQYRLEAPERRGAVVGTHKVTLVYKDPEQAGDLAIVASSKPKRPEFKLPPEAWDGSITFTVPEDGTDRADFSFGSRLARNSPKRRPTTTLIARTSRNYWYVGTISIWLLVLLGCFVWWRYNVRQLVDR